MRKMVAVLVMVVLHDGHSHDADADAADDADDSVRGYPRYNAEDCGGVFLLLLLRHRHHYPIRWWLHIEKKIMVDSSSMITTGADNRGNRTGPPADDTSARVVVLRVDTTAGGWSDHPGRVFHDQTHLSSWRNLPFMKYVCVCWCVCVRVVYGCFNILYLSLARIGFMYTVKTLPSAQHCPHTTTKAPFHDHIVPVLKRTAYKHGRDGDVMRFQPIGCSWIYIYTYV